MVNLNHVNVGEYTFGRVTFSGYVLLELGAITFPMPLTLAIEATPTTGVLLGLALASPTSLGLALTFGR